MINSESVMGIKPGDSDVVIGYQVDQFTHTLLVKHLIACLHIYTGFRGMVSTLIHFLLEPGCEDYCFFQGAIEDFKCCLDSILMDSINIL